MSSIPYAPTTCVDTATSIGAADATIIRTVYRFAGDHNYTMNFIGTLTSIGTGDSCSLQVSPDYDPDDRPAAAMWMTVETFTSTAFSGSLNGPWAAIRFIKPGVQACKVVGVVAGRNRSRINSG